MERAEIQKPKTKRAKNIDKQNARDVRETINSIISQVEKNIQLENPPLSNAKNAVTPKGKIYYYALDPFQAERKVERNKNDGQCSEHDEKKVINTWQERVNQFKKPGFPLRPNKGAVPDSTPILREGEKN